MESVSVRSPISTRFSAKIWQRTVDAINKSEDVIKEVNNFEKNSLLSYINDFAKEYELGNLYTDEENNNIEIAEQILKQLVVLTLNPDQSEITISKTPDRAFVLEKNEGKISFCELSYHSKSSLFDDCLQSSEVECSRNILCVIDIQKLQTDIETQLRKNNSINVDSPALSLLDNNPRLLDFALEHIIEKPFQYGDLGKDALRYLQFKERDAELGRLEFSQNALDLLYQDSMPPELCEFIRTGTKAGNEYEISRLFYECFKLTVEKNQNSSKPVCSGDRLYGYCRYILRDITNLNLVWTMGWTCGLRDFRPLFRFLLAHYEGHALHFGDLCLTANRKDHANSFLDLIKYNTHLTKISVCDLGKIAIGYIPELIEALQSNTSITKFIIKFCFADGVARVVEILKNNSTLEVLKLSWISDDHLIEVAKNLKYNKTLTTLKVRVCGLNAAQAVITASDRLTSLHFLVKEPKALQISATEEKALLASLKKNKALTSFEFPWKSEDLRKKCNEHLQSNLHSKTHLTKALLLSSLSEPVEGQLIIPQDVIRLICAALWDVRR